jgi:hypothetical protein
MGHDSDTCSNGTTKNFAVQKPILIKEGKCMIRGFSIGTIRCVVARVSLENIIIIIMITVGIVDQKVMPFCERIIKIKTAKFAGSIVIIVRTGQFPTRNGDG